MQYLQMKSGPALAARSPCTLIPAVSYRYLLMGGGGGRLQAGGEETVSRELEFEEPSKAEARGSFVRSPFAMERP